MYARFLKSTAIWERIGFCERPNACGIWILPHAAVCREVSTAKDCLGRDRALEVGGEDVDELTCRAGLERDARAELQRGACGDRLQRAGRGGGHHRIAARDGRGGE